MCKDILCKVIKKTYICTSYIILTTSKIMIKKTIRGILLIMIAFTVMPLTSCGDDDDWMSEEYLTGTWSTESDDGIVTYVRFYDNGRGEYIEYDYDGYLVVDDSFYWDADRHNIYLYYDNGDREVWDISFEGRNKFCYYFYDGGYTYFVRE